MEIDETAWHPETSLGHQVNFLGRLFGHHLHRRIAPLGVVPGQFAQLLALFEQDGLTQRELCEQVRVEQATMAYTLQRMERDGLVQRERDTQDGRRTRYLLTEHARTLRDPLIAAAREVNTLATEGLTEEQRAECLRMVHLAITNLNAAT